MGEQRESRERGGRTDEWASTTRRVHPSGSGGSSGVGAGAAAMASSPSAPSAASSSSLSGGAPALSRSARTSSPSSLSPRNACVAGACQLLGVREGQGSGACAAPALCPAPRRRPSWWPQVGNLDRARVARTRPWGSRDPAGGSRVALGAPPPPERGSGVANMDSSSAAPPLVVFLAN